MKPGDRVTILNQTPGGRVFVEGDATVVGIVSSDDRTLVGFDGDSTVTERAIDPRAQGLTAAELEVYVAGVNNLIYSTSEGRENLHPNEEE